MRVLVTGGAGFIGSWVIKNLVARNMAVSSFDRIESKKDWDLPIAHHFGDVRDATAVNESVQRVDGVIHLAAVLGTQETIQNPLPAIETNVHGSLNVFQACARYNKPCTYITVGNHWMQNPYSITKTCAERLAWMFNKEHGARIAVVRALNAYGPGQKAGPVRKIMPNFIIPALKGEPIQIYGDGSQVMDMIHVRDVAEVLVRALVVDHGNFTKPFEAGTGRVTSVQEIARLVLRETHYNYTEDAILFKHLPMRPGEPESSVVLGDPETLTSLGWGIDLHMTALEVGIKETTEYYKKELGL